MQIVSRGIPISGEKFGLSRTSAGTVEQVEFFRGENQLERAEFDNDGDGKINQTQFYSETGKIQRVERDSDQDGRSPSRWNPNGRKSSQGSAGTLR